MLPNSITPAARDVLYVSPSFPRPQPLLKLTPVEALRHVFQLGLPLLRLPKFLRTIKCSPMIHQLLHRLLCIGSTASSGIRASDINPRAGLQNSTGIIGSRGNALTVATPSNSANSVVKMNSVAILKITPFITAARLAFCRLADQNSAGKLDAHLSSYFVHTGKRALSDEEPENLILDGHYLIRTSNPAVSKGFNFLGGQGAKVRRDDTRKVDLSLVDPYSKRSNPILPVHFPISNHPMTGAFGIQPLGKPILNNKTVPTHTTKFLPSGMSVLEIGDLWYKIEFAIETREDERAYMEASRQRFAAEGWSNPHPRLSGIPIPSNAPQGACRIEQIVSSADGRYSLEDIEQSTSDLITYKVQRVDHPGQQQSTQAEVNTRLMMRNRYWLNLPHGRTGDLAGSHADVNGSVPRSMTIGYRGGIPFDKFRWETLQLIRNFPARGSIIGTT